MFSTAPIETFRFNFVIENQDDENMKDEEENNNHANHPSRKNHIQNQQQPSVDVASLIPAREHYLNDLSMDDSHLSYLPLSMTPKLTFLECNFSSDNTKLSHITDKSDVVSHVYEGGFKVWECAMDLCAFLQKHHQQATSLSLDYGNVLDLGCGHGFSGLYALLYENAQQVTFQDLNDEVLINVTMRNVWKNIQQQQLQTDEAYQPAMIAEFMSSHTRFISGDWCHPSLLLTLPAHSYTLILSTDTLYSPSTIPHLLSLLYHSLHPNGLVILASKRYYFGIGGGSLALQERVREDNKFICQIIEVIEDGKSNIREIITLKWKDTES